MLVGMTPSPLTFVERGGGGARPALEALRSRLRADGLAVRLLRSRDDADLHLLLVEGDPALDPADVEGARVWRFESVDADEAAG